jgi:hypothetical protein
VLIITRLLIVGGAIFFFISEYDTREPWGTWAWDRGSLHRCSVDHARTAGFNTINERLMTGPSKLVTMLLMFVGGSPGSTAGASRRHGGADDSQYVHGFPRQAQHTIFGRVHLPFPGALCRRNHHVRNSDYLFPR